MTWRDILRPVAASAVVAGTLAVGAGAAHAVGPCGLPAFSGDSSRVGNLVFLDDNDNGLFEPADGETGAAGVGVELWSDIDGDGIFEPTGDDISGLTCSTTTDADGRYVFSDVASDTYFVAITTGVPAGMAPSSQSFPSETADNNNNGADQAGYAAVSAAIVVDVDADQPLGEAAPGSPAGSDEAAADAADGAAFDIDSNLTIDFGFAPLAPTGTCVSIGNRVWLDTNGNGIDDGTIVAGENTEPGVDGVTMQLLGVDAGGDVVETVLATTTTVNGGYYSFNCVDEGTYVVRIPSTNFDAGNPLDGAESTIDLGSAPSNDLQDDGVNPAAAGDTVESAPVTVTSGNAPTGETDKPASAGLDFDDPNDESSDTTVDFGFTPAPVEVEPSSLGDYVWYDTDDDGVQDAGETGVVDVRINLRDSAGNVIGTTTTDDSGFYTFVGLTPGTYDVCFDLSTLPAGFEPTTADQGDDATDSDVDADDPCTEQTTLAAGEHDPTLDLGIVESAPVTPSAYDLGITKSGTVDGSQVTWTLVVTNNGPAAAPGPIVVTDTVSGDLDIVSTNGYGTFTCATADRTVTCTSSTDMAPGSSATITVVTRTNSTTGCSVTNSVAVGGSQPSLESNDADNTASATATVDCPATSPNNQSRLPVTGGNGLTLLTLAGLLTFAGARLLLSSHHGRPIAISKRLD